ncbi:MAG: alpha/beta fold hydrolase [Hyphomicrobiaceae bacterium]|nr:alpha/beta fold hydrolase [Hyphomicrobiaceae bacterium]
MPRFDSSGVEIAYERFGDGRPILLIHGFASNGQVNWVDTGWVETLTGAGFAPVLIDNRGHGRSEKLHDPAFYTSRIMAQDASNLIDHLGIGPLPVLGYSMGARIGLFLALDHPDRVSALILGGLGAAVFGPLEDREEIVEGLLAPSFLDVDHEKARMFRRFADSTESDLGALAARMRAPHISLQPGDIAKIEIPVLVVVGEYDDIAGRPEPLAECLPRGEALLIPRRDHMRATGDKKFKSGVLEFLDHLPR